MASRNLAWLGAALVAVTACSSSTTPDDGPICPTHQVQLSGTVGGTAVATTATPNMFNYDGSTGAVTFQWNTGAGSASLSFDHGAANDVAVPITAGTISLDTSMPPSFCVTSGHLVQRKPTEGSGVSFVLDMLATGACPGTAASGTIEGCATP